MENFSMILLFLVFACVNSLPIDDTNNLRFSRANSHHINLNSTLTQDLDDSISKQQQSSNAIGRNLDLQRQNVDPKPENAGALSNVGISSIVRVAAQVGIQSAVPVAAQPQRPQQPQPIQTPIRTDEQRVAIPAEPQIRQESAQPNLVSPVRVEPQSVQRPQEPVRVEAQRQSNEQIPVRANEQVVAAPQAQVKVEPQISKVEDKAPVRVEEQIQVRGQEPVRVEQPIPVVVKEPVRVDGQSELKAQQPVRVEGQTQVGIQIPVGVIGQSEPIAPQPVKAVEGQIVQEIVAPVVLVDRPNQIPVLLEAIPNQQQDSQTPIRVEVKAPEPIQAAAPVLVDGELVKVESVVAPVEGPVQSGSQIVLDGQRSD